MAEMDDYGRHEVLHMGELGKHAQVQANPEWKALADQAAEALWALYQSVGSAHLEGPRT